MFTRDEYDALAERVFRLSHPGYRPALAERHPDGSVDFGKRYAHIAAKYRRPGARDEGLLLHKAELRAHYLAVRVACKLGIPPAWWPDITVGALRVLEYPAGIGGACHTDQDLFTVMMYRDQPEAFVGHGEVPAEAREVNAQFHMGEIGELLGYGPATPHEVLPTSTPQHSIVYFAIPSHHMKLPSGQTVGEWLDVRMAKARVAR